MNTIERPYTVREVAQLIGKRVQTVRSYVRKGWLKRVGGAHSGLISTQSLRAFLDVENTTSGKAATDGDK